MTFKMDKYLTLTRLMAATLRWLFQRINASLIGRGLMSVRVMISAPRFLLMKLRLMALLLMRLTLNGRTKPLIGLIIRVPWFRWFFMIIQIPRCRLIKFQLLLSRLLPRLLTVL